MEGPLPVLDFWFGSAHHPQLQAFWFGGGDTIDRVIKSRFSDLYEQSLSGAFDSRSHSKEGAAALIILWDQFPRHLFRNDARMFESDARALAVAKEMIKIALDQDFAEVVRAFLYLPFEHSENLDDQKISINLFESLKDPNYLAYAMAHYRTIERFGRFPHRNKILKRDSSVEEQVFLESPPDSFFAG